MEGQKSDFSSKQEEAEFDFLLKKISTMIQFNSGAYKKSHLKRRVDVRVGITKCKTYSEYSYYLTKNPQEKQPQNN
jgi:chemotaxis methyl-accepting protein methylase